MADIERPDFSLMPDYGGTKDEFVKVLFPDRVGLAHIVGSRLMKVEVPLKSGFISVTLSEGTSGDFLYAYYTHAGELSSAQLHFKRYCEQSGFMEKARPSQAILDAYWQMKDAGEDIVASVDMETKEVYICHVEDLNDGTFRIISYSQTEFTENEGQILRMKPAEEDNIFPVDFTILVRDNILSLGIRVDEANAAEESVSAFASIKELSARSTPAELVTFLKRVFLVV